MRHSSVPFMKPVVRAGAGVALAAALVSSTAVPASAVYTSPVLTSTSGSWEAGPGMYLQYWRDSTSGNAHHPAWSHGVRVRWNEIAPPTAMWSSWSWANAGFWARQTGYVGLNAMQVRY